MKYRLFAAVLVIAILNGCTKVTPTATVAPTHTPLPYRTSFFESDIGGVNYELICGYYNYEDILVNEKDTILPVIYSDSITYIDRKTYLPCDNFEKLQYPYLNDLCVGQRLSEKLFFKGDSRIAMGKFDSFGFIDQKGFYTKLKDCIGFTERIEQDDKDDLYIAKMRSNKTEYYIIVDSNGKTITKRKYDGINISGDRYGTTIATDASDNAYLLENNGTEHALPKGIKDYIFNFDNQLDEFELKGKGGLINRFGEVIIQPEYDSIIDQNNGFFILQKDVNRKFFDSDAIAKNFAVDNTGKTIFSFPDTEVEEVINENCFIVSRLSDGTKKCVLVDSTNKILSQPWDYMLYAGADRVAAYIWINSGLVSVNFMDLSGKLILSESVYTDTFAFGFYNGFGRIIKDNKYYFIDTQGRIAIDASRYDYVCGFDNGTASVEINEKDKIYRNLIDTHGRELIKLKVAFCEPIKDGVYKVRLESGSFDSFCDAQGRLIFSDRWANAALIDAKNNVYAVTYYNQGGYKQVAFIKVTYT